MEDNPSLPLPPAPGLAIHQAPVIELKPSAAPVRKHQYQLPLEARIGILPYINRLKQAGILIECQSAWNTPTLPVKKEGGQDYRLVQDLRLVNQATVALHPTVPNPYTLLSFLPLSAKIYTCLDIKDNFFCICLTQVSQPIFAFEWEDPEGGTKQQLTCVGLANHKDLRIPQLSLGKPWLLTWIHSSQRGSDAGCYNMWMTCFWLPRTEKTPGKEPRLY